VADLHYLANLCHNCGECLYACQYAPPHPFGVSLPRALAQLRADSFERYCWPPRLAQAFERQGVPVVLGLTAAFSLLLYAGVVLGGPSLPPPGDFYAVIPHAVMVGLFGIVFLAALVALGMSLRQFWQAIGAGRLPPVTARAVLSALRDAATLRHLHGGGADCSTALDERRPWRRWAHHATLGGFALCFASTTVAAFYHSLFGWAAPYDYLSLPVVLGVLGGIGLIAGPAALLVLREQRDPALGDPGQRSLDTSLLVLLLVTSATGLALLAYRESSALRALLCLHLGAVLTFFVTIPYSKFVHGFYRLLALAQSERESRHESTTAGS
jgi:citrate/tricarballylate utilization protein